MFNPEPQDVSASPFHHGEQLAQARLGVRDIEDWARKVIRDHMPDQHRDFHTALPFLVVSARDAKGRPWVTLLDGPDGFVTAPDNRSLSVQTLPARGDALFGAIKPETDIGILGIELSTRRRNRANGRAAKVHSDGFEFRVDQTFGNCPQYIRERQWKRVDPFTRGRSNKTQHLSPEQQKWIAAADTFFVASGFRGTGDSPAFGMDASHRGGAKGFVQVLDSTRLRFPDYAGNNHYNTIGNLLLDPRAGLLFVDFASGGLLQLSGRASIDWDSDEVAGFPGARRLVTLDIDEVVETRSAVGLRWSSDAESVRSLRLIEKTPESADVTSFLFEARDHGPLPDFLPGQHLPIELEIPGRPEPVRRTYSLSNEPNTQRYRLTVKREAQGLASRFLHDRIEPGAIINSRPPSGDFVMTCSTCPVVLVSAGVGVTPMLSMLHAIADTASNRPVWFVHGARDGGHHPLAQEVREIASKRPNIAVHVAYSQPNPADTLGLDYDSRGRIDGALLAGLTTSPDAHYFLCGPVRFMGDVQTDLQKQGVPANHIHTESFGPSQ